MPFRELSSNDQGFVGIGADITEKCNRRCPTCFANHTQRDMNFTTFKKIVDEGVRARFTELYILGGEPALHPQVIDFLNYAQGKFNPIIFVTNMDKLSNWDFCQQIYRTGVVIAGQRHSLRNGRKARNMERLLIGGDYLEASHQAWENVTKLFSPERICVQCCITKPVVESGSIFEVFRWVRKNGYEPVMEFTKEGSEFKRGCSLDITPEEMLRVLQKFRRIDKEEFGLEGATILSPQAYGKTCHMLETSIHFLVDGTAIPCVGHHDLRYGNIIDSSLESILNHPLRQSISNPHEWIYGYCRDECQYFNECTGGCRGSSFDMSGCPRASFYYCPHIPRERLTISDMIPPTCRECPLEKSNICDPGKQTNNIKKKGELK
ncbi:radical SAM protein [Patescibacteria group bacterium]|nr:radical SAM protein [Patescibacteria group bacterium]